MKVDCGGGGEDDEEINIISLYRWRRGEIKEEIWGYFRVGINEVDVAGIIEILKSRWKEVFAFNFYIDYFFPVND